MAESPDTAEAVGPSRAEEAVAPSRDEYVRHVFGVARETLARSRSNGEQFRERPVDAPDAPRRSRGRPLAQPRDRTPPAPPRDTKTPTWADERAAVFEAISGLRQFCETLSDQLAAIRWRQVGSAFDTPHVAFGELSRWAREDRATIEAAGHSRDDQGKEIPPQRILRQT